MLPIVILIIALGWAGFALTWGRDRMRSNNDFRLPPDPYAVRRSSFIDVPRSEEAARVRRQQVLTGLIIAAILTFLMTRLWSIMWGLHLVVDVALISFAVAWYLRSSGARLVGASSSRPRGFNQPVPLAATESAGPVPHATAAYASVPQHAAPAPVVSGWVNSAPAS